MCTGRSKTDVLDVAGEISTVNRKTALYEMTCVVGVLRAQPQADLSS